MGKVSISLAGFGIGCGPLDSLIAHEGVHLIDFEPDAGRNIDARDREEATGRELELKCFNYNRK